MKDLKYPLDFTYDVTEADSIRSAILSVLLTQLNERPMQPEYGLNTAVFTNTAGLISLAEKAISEYIPYGEYQVFGSISEEGWYLLVLYDGLEIEVTSSL